MTQNSNRHPIDNFQLVLKIHNCNGHRIRNHSPTPFALYGFVCYQSDLDKQNIPDDLQI